LGEEATRSCAKGGNVFCKAFGDNHWVFCFFFLTAFFEISETKPLPDIAKLLAAALSSAHNSISAKKEDIFSVGTTTLIGGIVAPITVASLHHFIVLFNLCSEYKGATPKNGIGNGYFCGGEEFRGTWGKRRRIIGLHVYFNRRLQSVSLFRNKRSCF
jgi:hypothetical protein